MKRSVVMVLCSAAAAALLAGAGGPACAAAGDIGGAERIAYQWSQIGAREIRVMHADGAQAVDLPAVPGGVGDKITPALSPDGIAIAFATPTKGHSKIWVWKLGPDNKPVGQPQQVTFGDTEDEQPAFSPDGSKIAYVARKDEGRTIEVKPIDGDQPPARAAAILGGFHATTPSWSPDGTRLAYAQDDGIWATTVEGQKERLYDRGSYPAWSPDGGRVAFMVRNDPRTSSLWTLDLETRAATRVIDNLSGAGALAWSPDGERIAFKATRAGNREGRHWTVQADGTGLTPLPTENEPSAYLAWAPVNAPEVEVGEGPDIVPPPVTTGPVKIVTPRNGQTVRGDVRIKADLPDPEGYVMVRIANAVGGDLLVGMHLDQGFRLAVASPWEYRWDTRADGDGEKIISIDGYDQAAQYLGTQQIRVMVENEIKDPRIAQDGILLKIEFTGDRQKLTREVTGSADSTEDYALDRSQQLSALAAELEAIVVQSVERIDRFTNLTLLRNRIRGRESNITAGGVAYPLFESAVYARTELQPTGLIEPVRRTGGERLALAETSLELSSKPVRIGESWRSPMKVVTELVSRQGATVQGTHVFERLEWEGDYRCAKIKSTYNLPATVRIPLTIRTGLEEETAPGMGPTPMPMPSPATGWRPAGEGAAETTVTMKGARGTRYTWVGYETRQVIRIDDVITGSLDVPTQWLSGIGPAGTTGSGTSYGSTTGYRPYAGSQATYTPINYRITLSSRLTGLSD